MRRRRFPAGASTFKSSCTPTAISTREAMPNGLLPKTLWGCRINGGEGPRHVVDARRGCCLVALFPGQVRAPTHGRFHHDGVRGLAIPALEGRGHPGEECKARAKAFFGHGAAHG
jgi:hypothetical protein